MSTKPGLFAAAALLIFLAAPTYAQTITTFAGGRRDDGLPAAHVGFGWVTDVAFDAAGNMYVSDVDNEMVRRIDAVSGKSTVIAGNGTSGMPFEGQLAAEAALGAARGVAVDSAGNVYISDTVDHRVWRVDAATKTIHTFAGGGSALGDGGPATSAQVTIPLGVTLDAAGNVYVSDNASSRIRSIDARTGIITTVAGNGTAGYSGDGGLATSAELKGPYQIALDSSGNLFIADANNAVIRKVAAATGIITTVAGMGGKFGFSGDGGPATAAMLSGPAGVAVDSHDNLFIGDQNESRIRKVDASTGVISTIAGTGTLGFSGDGGPAAAATFYAPLMLAFNAAGNLYVADYGNLRVRKIDTSGNISTVAGSDLGDGGPATSAQLLIPIGVAVAPSGNVYFADIDSRSIRKIDAVTNTISTVAGGLRLPGSVIVDSAENVYFVDSIQVMKIDAATKAVSVFAGNNTSGFGGDGGPATAAPLSVSITSGLALDASGNLYIADTFDSRIRKVDHTTGVITTIAGTGSQTYSGDSQLATFAGIPLPRGIAVDPSGNIYLVDNTERIRRIDASGIITTIAGGPGSSLTLPEGLAYDGNGNLLIVDTTSQSVKRLNLATVQLSTLAGSGAKGFSGDFGPATSAALNNPRAVAAGPRGSVYIADGNNNRIRVVTTAPPRHRAVAR